MMARAVQMAVVAFVLASHKCSACKGDCDRDPDCKPGLKFLQRKVATVVPSCKSDGRADDCKRGPATMVGNQTPLVCYLVPVRSGWRTSKSDDEAASLVWQPARKHDDWKEPDLFKWGLILLVAFLVLLVVFLVRLFAKYVRIAYR
jgi:hypothetical protein